MSNKKHIPHQLFSLHSSAVSRTRNNPLRAPSLKAVYPGKSDDQAPPTADSDQDYHD
jgi:hypothetical protein